ncbi:MAG: Arm DNA-binding domain-containing protein [Spirosomataceae bacterium]
MNWIKFDLIFNRTRKLNRKGKALVQIQAYLNGCRRYFSTQVYLTPTEWDTKRQEPKEPLIRARVRGMLSDFEKFVQKNHAEGKIVTLSDLDLYVKSNKKIEVIPPKLTFTDFVTQQLKDRSAG